MVSNYIPKNNPLGGARLQKIAKKLIEESTEDRNLALETMRYFKSMVEENQMDSTAKGLIVDCLKLAQSSKDKTIKIMDLLIKIEKQSETETTKAAGNKSQNVFSVLNELSD